MIKGIKVGVARYAFLWEGDTSFSRFHILWNLTTCTCSSVLRQMRSADVQTKPVNTRDEVRTKKKTGTNAHEPEASSAGKWSPYHAWIPNHLASETTSDPYWAHVRLCLHKGLCLGLVSIHICYSMDHFASAGGRHHFVSFMNAMYTNLHPRLFKLLVRVD